MRMILKDNTEFEMDSLDYVKRELSDNGGRETIMVSVNCKDKDIKNTLKEIEGRLSKENISKVTFQTAPADGSDGVMVEYSFSAVDAVNMHIRDAASSIDVRFLL